MAGSLWRKLPNKTFLPRINNEIVRTLTGENNGHRIVASDDGRTVVCWHPEVDFPYEKSLPIKLVPKTDHVLKVQNIEGISFSHLRKPEFVREKLMELTFTTKHRWFPEGIHARRRRRNFEQSRPYL